MWCVGLSRRAVAGAGLLVLLPLISCAARRPAASPDHAAPQPEQSAAAEPEMVAPRGDGPTRAREVFPFVRADAASRTVEFDGWVPIDAHNPKTPRVYLEQMVCAVDSREHESLVVTKAKPSNIHAALLLAGLVPGTPGAWRWEGREIKPIPPTGPRVRVTFVVPDADGVPVEHDPAGWVRLVKQDTTLAAASPDEGFVFAGSRFVTRRGREYYHADVEGTIVGLTTFGSETIAWTGMLSPEAAVQTPDWVARAQTVPPVGTPVVVRIRPAE